MAVPKKRTSISKKNIRKNFWKKKGYWTALKALSLSESIFTDKSKSFSLKKKTDKPKGFFLRK
uniref:Large ribosomal subunit protein bL32c n=2 Tax=Medicago TaxID=3877 RepID=A0A7L8XNT6_9FABA|nr:ribosomal protein L32 [Medicago archiducis-nicolai]YP_010010897.1 ribosomal protein L32 [Medicago ruthenica]QOI00507.1 ribosomal protein L32 [Medicago archiducis-nicolai]QOI00518.1 ribosomal protein L32 [Medicago ruthenica]QUS53887.1 ribosomal protein L32 [Medicago ruthenica]